MSYARFPRAVATFFRNTKSFSFLLLSRFTTLRSPLLSLVVDWGTPRARRQCVPARQLQIHTLNRRCMRAKVGTRGACAVHAPTACRPRSEYTPANTPTDRVGAPQTPPTPLHSTPRAFREENPPRLRGSLPTNPLINTLTALCQPGALSSRPSSLDQLLAGRPTPAQLDSPRRVAVRAGDVSTSFSPPR